MNAIEKNYKKHYLPIIEEHAELFTYKINEPLTEATAADLSELIVDEFSKSDMDEYLMRIASKQEKFDDWRFFDSDERLQDLRFDMTKYKLETRQSFEVYPYYVDELWPAHTLLFTRHYVTENALDIRDKKVYKNESIWRRMFGYRSSFVERDQEDWFVKNGFELAHLTN